MLRILLAGMLGALLALPATSLQTQTSPGAIPEGLVGRAFGAWNLPLEKEPGIVHGVLLDVGGRKLVLEARLIDTPMRGVNIGGNLEGVVLAIDRDGTVLQRVALVNGTYFGGPDHRGSFQAVLTNRTSRPDPIGFIEGLFSDPVVRGKDPIGRFAARWKIL